MPSRVYSKLLKSKFAPTWNFICSPEGNIVSDESCIDMHTTPMEVIGIGGRHAAGFVTSEQVAGPRLAEMIERLGQSIMNYISVMTHAALATFHI
jgi:hypothetical protein